MLIIFSKATWLSLAIVTMLIVGIFIQMSNGATYALIPFINRNSIGSVAGVVGAGGNVGAVLFGFLFRSEQLSYSTALFYLGIGISIVSICSLLIRFSLEDEKQIKAEFDAAYAKRLETQPV